MGATLPVPKDGQRMAYRVCKSDPRGLRGHTDQNDCEACPIESMAGISEQVSSEKFKDNVTFWATETIKVGQILAKIEAKELKKQDFEEYWEQVGQRKKHGTTEYELREQDEVYTRLQDLKGKCKNEEVRETIVKFNKMAELLATLSKPADESSCSLVRKWVAVQRTTLVKSPWCLGPKVEKDFIYRTSPLKKAWYIVFPMIVFAFSFAAQSLLLHWTTMLYIRYMNKGTEERRDQGGELFDVVGHYVGLATGVRTKNEGAVVDGHVQIPLKLLDASAALPLVLCVATFGFSMFSSKPFNIGLWNTAFIVASIMAVLKGVTDVITIMPDSMGWDVCKDRLGRDGLNKLGHYSFHNLIGSLLNLFVTEFFGGQNGRRIRYCADMMISGHTYFTVIFSQAAYRNVEYMTAGFDDWKYKCFPYTFVRRGVAILCYLCVVTEVTLVAMARFHYTSDMLLSIILVILIFDSIHIGQIAADWSEGFSWQDPESFVPESSLQGLIYSGCKGCCPVVKEESVVPSQGYMVNLRRVANYQPWSNAKPKKDSNSKPILPMDEPQE